MIFDSNTKETYLGDGLYASHDGFQYVLRAPRGHENHFVALEPEVLQKFISYVERVSNVTITVTKNAKRESA